MRITYKTTIWHELRFEDNLSKEAIAALVDLIKKEGIYSAIDEELGFEESQPLFDTEIVLLPEDNDGESTIEVYDDDNKLIWENNE